MNIHLSCPSTCTVLTDIQKLLTHGMSNRGKFTLRNSKGYLQAKNSVRWRFVKKPLKITWLVNRFILFKSLVLMKQSHKSFRAKRKCQFGFGK